MIEKCTLLNGRFSDLTVIIGTNSPVPFRLHKLIMCANSGYFAGLFGNSTLSKFKENEESIVTIPSEDPDVFERMVIFFYGNWPASENIVEASKLYVMADYFDASDMKRAAMEDIIAKLFAAASGLGERIYLHHDYDTDYFHNAMAMKYKGVRAKITPEQRRAVNIFGFHPSPEAPTSEDELALESSAQTKLGSLAARNGRNEFPYEDSDDDSDSYCSLDAKQTEREITTEQNREVVMEELMTTFTSVGHVYQQQDKKLFERFIKAFNSTGILKDIYNTEIIRDFLKMHPEFMLKVGEVILA